MKISCNTIVDRRDHVQYLTVSKSYSDNCTCSLTEQNTTTYKMKIMNLSNIRYSIQINGTVHIYKLRITKPYTPSNIHKSYVQIFQYNVCVHYYTYGFAFFCMLLYNLASA